MKNREKAIDHYFRVFWTKRIHYSHYLIFFLIVFQKENVLFVRLYFYCCFFDWIIIEQSHIPNSNILCNANEKSSINENILSFNDQKDRLNNKMWANLFK